jgi:hypothetical protein
MVVMRFWADSESLANKPGKTADIAATPGF